MKRHGIKRSSAIADGPRDALSVEILLDLATQLYKLKEVKMYNKNSIRLTCFFSLLTRHSE